MKVHGIRIELEEMEVALQKHPQYTGQLRKGSESRLIAFVSAEPECCLFPSSLREHLCACLHRWDRSRRPFPADGWRFLIAVSITMRAQERFGCEVPVNARLLAVWRQSSVLACGRSLAKVWEGSRNCYALVDKGRLAGADAQRCPTQTAQGLV